MKARILTAHVSEIGGCQLFLELSCCLHGLSEALGSRACSRPRAPNALLQPQPLEQPGIRQIRGAGALCVFQSRGFLQNSASGLSAHGDLLLRGVEMSKQA